MIIKDVTKKMVMNVKASQKPTVAENEVKTNKEKGKKILSINPIPRPLPPFLQRLKKDKEEKYQKFISILKELTMNIPLVEALEKMPSYAKSMQYLVTKNISYEPIGGLHYCSASTSNSLMQKKGDLDAFIIPCMIGSSNLVNALCDTGASINLMRLSMFK